MKKILLSTIVLTVFSFSIILFDISCKKTATADPAYTLPIATTSKLGGVIPDGTTIAVDGTGKISTVATSTQQGKLLYTQTAATTNITTLWTSNYDGTDPQKVNITLPTGGVLEEGGFGISPDHKTIFFAAYIVTQSNGFEVDSQDQIYSCNFDGSNIKKILTGSDEAIAY